LRIYVGNLPYSVTSEDLTEMFGEHGSVSDVTVVMDRDTGRSKGFGFVEMQNNTEADRAIKELNGSAQQGRTLTVNQARPREDRRSSGGRW